jgi:hypothetical protein
MQRRRWEIAGGGEGGSRWSTAPDGASPPIGSGIEREVGLGIIGVGRGSRSDGTRGSLSSRLDDRRSHVVRQQVRYGDMAPDSSACFEPTSDGERQQNGGGDGGLALGFRLSPFGLSSVVFCLSRLFPFSFDPPAAN